MIPVVKENIRVKLALAIPTGVPIMLVNKLLRLLHLKQLKLCLCTQTQVHIA